MNKQKNTISILLNFKLVAKKKMKFKQVPYILQLLKTVHHYILQHFLKQSLLNIIQVGIFTEFYLHLQSSIIGHMVERKTFSTLRRSVLHLLLLL